MGKPKKQTSHRKTGFRQSHLVLDLARRVNGKLSNIGSKVRAFTTKRESGKNSVAATGRVSDKKAVATKTPAKKAA